MKRSYQTALAAALLSTLGLVAVAQTPAAPAQPQGQAPHQEMHAHARHGMGGEGRLQERIARMEERIAKRQAALKQKLGISAAQESAWGTWTQSLKPAARPQRPDRAEFARLTTPERIDRMRALRAARMAEMDRRAEATKAFYAALNPEQKKVFDEETLRFGKKRGGHRGHGGRHHRS
jgi:protein CpxP